MNKPDNQKTQPYSNEKTGLQRLLHAFLNSYRGLRYLIKTETAFQQEFILFLLVLPIIFWLDLSVIEKSLLLVVSVLVLIVEVVNTAIERAIDRIGMHHHLLSGLAKDLGSLAVLLSILLAISVWGIILLSN